MNNYINPINNQQPQPELPSLEKSMKFMAWSIKEMAASIKLIADHMHYNHSIRPLTQETRDRGAVNQNRDSAHLQPQQEHIPF
jgi:hypothetical protein